MPSFSPASDVPKEKDLIATFSSEEKKAAKLPEHVTSPLNLDGKAYVFIASRPVRDRLCQWDMVDEGRALDEENFKPLPGHDGAVYCFHHYLAWGRKKEPCLLIKTKKEIQLWGEVK